MTQDALARLLELVEKATPGPWHIGEPGKHLQPVVRSQHIELFTCWHNANAALIAACSPEVVAALVRDAMRYQWLRDKAPHTVGYVPFCVIGYGNEHDTGILGDNLDEAIDAALAKGAP